MGPGWELEEPRVLPELDWNSRHDLLIGLRQLLETDVEVEVFFQVVQT